MAGRLEGKMAIVTGAASGLGRADAIRMAEEGARLVLTDVNEDGGRTVAGAIPGALFLPHDVRDEAAWQDVVAKTVDHFGRLDILVNNAGVLRFSDVEQETIEGFRFVNAVMNEGTFLGCKHAIPAMAASGGGSIINIASTSAVNGYSAILAYTAAKGAIIAMTRSVAVHCQERGNGVRCNVVIPGAHDTPMMGAAFDDTAGETRGRDKSAGKGMGDPVEVANAVLFLASDESRWMTGAQMVIDNGETIR